MGPTCEILLKTNGESALDLIDAILAKSAEPMIRTQKGRAWDVHINGRPIHISMHDSSRSVTLAAGCNQSEDYDCLRKLAEAISTALGGIASEPSK